MEGNARGQRTAYLNARLLDPATGLDAKGALLTDGDTIADVGPNLFKDSLPEAANLVDCRGLCLAPGLIDMHVFTGEPGYEHRETLATAGRAAAAGGITTMVTMPNTDPVIDEVSLVDFILRRARETAPVRVLPMAAATKALAGKEMTEFGLLDDAGAVGFTDGDQAIASASLMCRALAYASTFDAVIVQVCEEPSLTRDGAMSEGELALRLGLPALPHVAETIMVERDLRLVEATGGRWHAAHLSTAQSLDAIRSAKARGLKVTAGAAVHSFALNDTAIGDYRTFAKAKPPLRDESDRQAVVAALADGTIDVISSAHCPQDPESKRLPFAQAAFGMIGLETMLPLALELAHNGQVPLLKVIAAMTCNPAKILRLDSGRLAKGAPADLVLFDPDAPWVVDEKKMRSKAKNTPFDARPVQGHIRRTIVAGKTVFERRRES
jgi:dihydroorotase